VTVARSRAAVIEDPELGPLRYCAGCDDFWPLDGEFWFFERTRPGVVHCKSCVADAQRRKKARGRRVVA
jgi:hypothetical protein